MSSLTFRRASEVADLAGLTPALDAIFFEASLTKSFAGEAARAAFRERWLGRYLTLAPKLAHFAFVSDEGGGERLAGYVVGTHDDPAHDPRFADIGYFPSLAAWTRRFPAHLHINLAAAERSRGIGSALIERFAADAAAAGAAGVHVVTGAASRNVAFYRRNGFDTAHVFPWNGADLVLLGRDVVPLDDPAHIRRG